MLLNELLKAIQPVEVAGDSNIEITGVNIDSRLVEAGQLFMAMRGTQARRPCLYTCCHRKRSNRHPLRGYAGRTRSGDHLCTSKRQRRCGRKDCHYLLRRPDFQVGTGRRYRNERKNNDRYLII